MPDAKCCESYGRNPFVVPEPHYLPGYTGHCPRYNEIVGHTYARATHMAMKENVPVSSRLKSLSEDSQEQSEPSLQQEELDILKERNSPVLTMDITPGYKGHIPHASRIVGMTFNQSCVKGIAEFEKNRKERGQLRQVAVSDTEVLEKKCS